MTEADLTAAHDLLRSFNPAMRMLLSVSPVTLTATAEGFRGQSWEKSFEAVYAKLAPA